MKIEYVNQIASKIICGFARRLVSKKFRSIRQRSG